MVPQKEITKWQETYGKVVNTVFNKKQLKSKIPVQNSRWLTLKRSTISISKKVEQSELSYIS